MRGASAEDQRESETGANEVHVVSVLPWRVVRAAVVFATFLLLQPGCGEDPTTSSDLGVGPPDLAAATSLTLTLPGGGTRPMSAYYSFYVAPLPDEGPAGAFLLVTAVDPAFDCARAVGRARRAQLPVPRAAASARSPTSIASRRGPDFGSTVGGNASGRLVRDDDRYVGYELDGGVIDVGAGGYVGGTLHFDDGGLVLDGAVRRDALRSARRRRPGGVRVRARCCSQNFAGHCAVRAAVA